MNIFKRTKKSKIKQIHSNYKPPQPDVAMIRLVELNKQLDSNYKPPQPDVAMIRLVELNKQLDEIQLRKPRLISTSYS